MALSFRRSLSRARSYCENGEMCCSSALRWASIPGCRRTTRRSQHPPVLQKPSHPNSGSMKFAAAG
jgi:hypothetical protein